MAIDAISGAASYSASNTVTNMGTAAVAQPITSAVKVDVVDNSTKSAVKSDATVKQDGSFANQADGSMTEDKMKKAIDDINRNLQDKTCEFGYDEVTNRVTIKIIDKETDEVIRELPPEKTLRMIAKAWELAGILVDEKL